MKVFRLAPALFLVLLCSGCGGPLRHYKFASHGPNCKEAKDPRCSSDVGDITHVSDPGAKVVVPKGKP